MERSRYAFAVASTGRRPEKTNEPQLVVTSTKGNFKINGAASRLMKLQHGDHAALVNNEADVTRAIEAGDIEEGTPVTWGIIKGYPALDASGNVRKAVQRLSKEDEEKLVAAGEVDDDGNVLTQYEDKIVGFKLAAVNKAAGVGNSLGGSDAVNYEALGGNTEKNIVYEIETEPTPVDIDGLEVDLFVLGASTEVEKMKRK